MTPAATVPPADFTSYLLQQTALRASLLQTSFGSNADDWDDLRQDLALDCLRRLPKFDETRGSWKGFVRGVVRNHAWVLAAQPLRRTAASPLHTPANPSSDQEAATVVGAALTEDLREALDLSIDMRKVIASLPAELQAVALDLSEFSLEAARRRAGLTRSAFHRKIARIRGVFVTAGLAPGRARDNGGGR